MVLAISTLIYIVRPRIFAQLRGPIMQSVGLRKFETESSVVSRRIGLVFDVASHVVPTPFVPASRIGVIDAAGITPRWNNQRFHRFRHRIRSRFQLVVRESRGLTYSYLCRHVTKVGDINRREPIRRMRFVELTGFVSADRYNRATSDLQRPIGGLGLFFCFGGVPEDASHRECQNDERQKLYGRVAFGMIRNFFGVHCLSTFSIFCLGAAPSTVRRFDDFFGQNFPS